MPLTNCSLLQVRKGGAPGGGAEPPAAGPAPPPQPPPQEPAAPQQQQQQPQQPQARGVSRDCLRSLRHTFIVCTGYQRGAGGEHVLFREPVVVEPRFKEQFVIAHPTRQYDELLQVRRPSAPRPPHCMRSRGAGSLAHTLCLGRCTRAQRGGARPSLQHSLVRARQ